MKLIAPDGCCCLGTEPMEKGLLRLNLRGPLVDQLAHRVAAHPAAVPFFALCFFAGIRPCLRTGEILRLQPHHVRLAEGVIRIDGEVSKVREPRTIMIQPNRGEWLRAYPLDRFPIVPANLQHMREKAGEKFDLSPDVMRHTFISMFVAKYRSVGEAALQAGSSESIIRKHYLDLKNAAEAEAFLGITPDDRFQNELGGEVNRAA